MDYPSEFEFDALLRDGRVIHFRPIRPDDAQRESEFFARVGPVSVYHRFLIPKPDLSPGELRYFTTVDYDERMALIALHGDDMVAVGRYDVLPELGGPDQRVAEIALLVEDDYQGCGIGSHLMQHLTVYARLRGITAFEGFVLADNLAMLRLFRSSGYRLTRQLEEGVYRIEFPTEYSPEAREAEWEHEKRSTAASLMPLLYPGSIAVIGAGRDTTSVGGRLFRNLLAQGFNGPIHPVNPHAPFVHAVKAFETVLDIPDAIDLAFIAVPAPAVADTLRQCARKGVRGVVVISAGFAETGREGLALEETVREIARRNGMRLIGPNCMGVINTDIRVNLNGQFGPSFPPPGNVGISSQSGALGIAILEEAAKLNIGVSTFVSIGNRADVSPNDLLLYWEDDPHTDVIVLYVESVGNPRRFGRLARRISRKKPIVVVKAGRSRGGARATASHTGSMASLEAAVDALFSQSGVIRTGTLHELFDVTSLLVNQPLPDGRRVAVLSNTGGPAILAVDALEGLGLEVPELSAELQAQLAQHLSPAASTVNPIDMIASAGLDEYRACLPLLLESDEIDAVIVIFIPTAPEGTREILSVVGKAVCEHRPGKTVVGVLMGSAESPEELTCAARVPVYPFPESAAQALAAAVRYGEWRKRPEGAHVDHADIDRARGEAVVRGAISRLERRAGWLSVDEVERLLDAYGIASARAVVVQSEDDAIVAASDIGGPVALKVVSPTLTHKSDVGGVAIDIEGEDAVRRAYRRVASVADDVEGVLVQTYVEGDLEVIVGMTEDPIFGPLVGYGLGGVFVELMRDVSFRINPLTDLDAREMMSDVRSSELLTGYRGRPAGDVDAVVDLLLRVSDLVDAHPQIAEMDLNPVKVLEPGRGVIVVDARIRVRPLDRLMLPSRKDIPGRMV